MTESVTLEELRSKLAGLTVPLWLRAAPSFLIWLSLLESGLALAGLPSLLAGAGPLPAVAAHAVMIGAALFLRRYSSLHGWLFGIAPPFAAAGADQPTLAQRPFGIDPADAAARRRRRVFLVIFILLTVAGGIALAMRWQPLAWIPVRAFAWAAAAIMLAYAATLTLFAGPQKSDLAGLAVALVLALIPLAAQTDLLWRPARPFLLDLGALAAALTALLYIALDDPLVGRLFRLEGADKTAAPTFPWSPDRRWGGRAYLSFGLNAPMVAFMRGLDDADTDFRPVSMSNVNASIPLHDRHLWIWNLAAIAEMIPEEMELSDGASFIDATAEITWVFGAAAIDENVRISQHLLDTAAHNVFTPNFRRNIEAALTTTFFNLAVREIEALEAIRRKLSAAPTEVTASARVNSDVESMAGDVYGMDAELELAAYRAMLLPLERTAQEYKTLAQQFEADCLKAETDVDQAVSRLKMLKVEAVEKIASTWKQEIARRFSKLTVRGTTVSLEEIQTIIEMLGLEAKIKAVREGPALQSLRGDFAAARRAVAETHRSLNAQVEVARREFLDHLRKKGLIVDEGLARDPIILLQSLRARARLDRPQPMTPEPGGSAAPKELRAIESPARPRRPRNK